MVRNDRSFNCQERGLVSNADWSRSSQAGLAWRRSKSVPNPSDFNDLQSSAMKFITALNELMTAPKKEGGLLRAGANYVRAEFSAGDASIKIELSREIPARYIRPTGDPVHPPDPPKPPPPNSPSPPHTS
jgi:hypothetical protein